VHPQPRILAAPRTGAALCRLVTTRGFMGMIAGGNWKLRICWLLGFFLTANVYLVPSLTQSPRATDLIGLILAAVLIGKLARDGLPAGALTILAVANALPAVWLGWALFEGDFATVAQAGRWLLAVPWALALVLLLQTAAARRAFAWGLVGGGVVNVAVVLLQATGREHLLRAFGLSSAGATFYHYVYHMVRIPGMHGHPNASTAVASLLVPAALYLYLRRHAGAWLPLGAIGAFFVAAHLTSTRSPVVVVVVSVLLGLLAARAVGRAVLFGGFLIGVVVPAVLLLGPPGGRSRWRDILALEANTDERLASGLNAAGVALDHPFGIGVTGGQAALYERSFLQATHNALLQAALYFGLALALLLLVAILVRLLKLARGRAPGDFLPGLLALQCFGLFLFEEHLNNPTFVILASWFMAMLGAPGGTAAVKGPVPASATARPEERPPERKPPLPAESA
jgi:hypothetical protein